YLAVASDLGFGRIVGVEIDRAAAARASRYGTVLDDIACLEKGQYDVVQVKNVLANIADVRSFFSKSVAALKEGGYCYVDVLNASGINARLKAFDNALKGRGTASGVFRPPFVIN